MATTLTCDSLRKAFLWALMSSWGLMLAVNLLHLDITILVMAPILIMCLYLWNFNKSCNTDAFREQFADSFYALGFLLTLTALVFSFFPLLVGKASITMEGTIGNFGMALVTTLFGLTVRIYMTSFTKDLEHIQAQAVCDLEQDVRLFKEEMASSIKVMRSFNTELEEVTKKTVEDFAASLSGAGKEITGLVTRTMQEALAPLTDTFTALSGQIDDSTKHFGKDLEGAFSQCIAGVKAIEVEPDLLGNLLKPVVEKFNAVGFDISTNVQHISESLERSTGSLNASVNEFTATTKTLNTKLAQSIEKMAQDFATVEIDPHLLTRMLDSAFKEFREAVAFVAEQTRKQGQWLRKNSAAIEESMPGYEKIVHNLSQIIALDEKMAKPVQQFTDLGTRIQGLASSIHGLEKQSEAFISSVGESLQTYRKASTDMEQEREGIKEIRYGLEKELGKTTTTLSQLATSFTDIAEFITITLKTRQA